MGELGLIEVPSQEAHDLIEGRFDPMRSASIQGVDVHRVDYPGYGDSLLLIANNGQAYVRPLMIPDQPD